MAFEYGPLVARDHVPQADSTSVIARYQRSALGVKLNALDLSNLVAGGAGIERIQRFAARHIPQLDHAVGTTGSQHCRIRVEGHCVYWATMPLQDVAFDPGA